MTLPKSVYEIMKFLANFISGMTAIVSGLLIAFGVGEHDTNLIIMCIAAAGQIIVLFVNTAAKNHWKAVAEDGTTEDIKEIEDSDDDVDEDVDEDDDDEDIEDEDIEDEE